MVRVIGFSLPAYGLSALAVAVSADGCKLPMAEPCGRIEIVANSDGSTPIGVTVSHKGRIFVNFPRWSDKWTLSLLN